MRPWLQLTKPGITLFIVLTAAAGFVAAQPPPGSGGLLVAALLATLLLSAGAAALNHVLERDGDARMGRTARRPLASGAIGVRRAAVFAWTLSGLGLLVAALWLPVAATLLLVASHVSYVFVYTPLKRRTAYCTLAGAVPGTLPVLAGWCAAGQPLALPALALAGVMFMWQIPHFLAIGWLTREDYARAGCVMLGVTDPSGAFSARVAFVYAAAMAVSAGVLLVTTPTGAVYGVAALLAAGAYTFCAWRFVRAPGPLPARQLFVSSLLALPLLLASLMADLLLSA
jgi:heme o synthase